MGLLRLYDGSQPPDRHTRYFKTMLKILVDRALMQHISFLFYGILFDAQSIHVLCSRHNNRCKQSVPRIPLYMLWDLILTSYTINSLPVCCSTNKLLKTWLGKAKFFCIRFNLKTKQKPATKIQDHVFLLLFRENFHPNRHLAWFCTHSSLQLFTAKCGLDVPESHSAFESRFL